MQLHWCGNPLHDVPMLALWLLSFAPDWVPMVNVVRVKLSELHG